MKYSIFNKMVVKRSNNSGSLFSLDLQTLGFEFKRIYFIKDVPKGITRGFHSHKNLNQALFCVHGQIEIKLDDGIHTKKVILDNPHKILMIGPGIWREMTWIIDDSILFVMASDKYDEEDYIRDYDTFIEMVKEGYWSNEN